MASLIGEFLDIEPAGPVSGWLNGEPFTRSVEQLAAARRARKRELRLAAAANRAVSLWWAKLAGVKR